MARVDTPGWLHMAVGAAKESDPESGINPGPEQKGTRAEVELQSRGRKRLAVDCSGKYRAAGSYMQMQIARCVAQMQGVPAMVSDPSEGGWWQGRKEVRLPRSQHLTCRVACTRCVSE